MYTIKTAIRDSYATIDETVAFLLKVKERHGNLEIGNEYDSIEVHTLTQAVVKEHHGEQMLVFE